jgi:hypothetical protein
MAFTKALIGAHRDVGQGAGHDLRGLNASLQGAGGHHADWQTSQSLRQIGSLSTTYLVKANALGPSRQRSAGVG